MNSPQLRASKQRGSIIITAPTLTDVSPNVAYRYMDWFLIAPLLLLEMYLGKEPSLDKLNTKAWTPGRL